MDGIAVFAGPQPRIVRRGKALSRLVGQRARRQRRPTRLIRPEHSPCVGDNGFHQDFRIFDKTRLNPGDGAFQKGRKFVET